MFISPINFKSSIQFGLSITVGVVGKFVTITELQEQNEEMANYSNQKLSALLKQLVDSNVVARQVDKKKAYFKLVD